MLDIFKLEDPWEDRAVSDLPGWMETYWEDEIWAWQNMGSLRNDFYANLLQPWIQ